MRPRAERALAVVVALGAALLAAGLASCAGTKEEPTPPMPHDPKPVSAAEAPVQAAPEATPPAASRKSPAPFGAASAPAADCRASLVAATTSVRPGAPAAVGVRLELAAHHHVYWKNPGDSGLAPTIDWTLPAGWTAGPIDWPAPRRIVAAGLVSFGYEDAVVLPVAMTIPADASPGDAVIAAHVKWLVCSEEACVPGEARLELTLTVTAGQSQAAKWADGEALGRWIVESGRTGYLHPAALPAGAARLAATGDAWTLTVDLPDLAPDPTRTADFFPDEPLVLDSAAVPVLESSDGGRLRLRLTPAARTGASVDRLRGVLVVTTARSKNAYAVDVPKP